MTAKLLIKNDDNKIYQSDITDISSSVYMADTDDIINMTIYAPTTISAIHI